MQNSMTEWGNIISRMEKQEFLFSHMYNDLFQKKDHYNNFRITQQQGLNFTVLFSNEGLVTQ